MRTLPGLPPHHHGLSLDGEELPGGEYNPPGQSQLSYRAGDYKTFLQRMLRRLQTQQIHYHSGPDQKPLASLNLQDSGDLAVALLRAWAVVGDVLTFYQERIANEGYWRTATERLSISLLVRTIGHHLHPGLAATTNLAFTVSPLTNGASATTIVPSGTAAMSTPVGSQQPQIFETVEELEASVAWNSLSPFLPTFTIQQQVSPGANELRLPGINTRLKAADPVLLVGEMSNQPGESVPGTWLRIVKSVAANKGGGYTLLTLEPSATDDNTWTTLGNPQLFVFRRQASLYGFNAPNWNDTADNIKRKYGTVMGGTVISHDATATWQLNNKGLPPGNVRALAIGADGSIFAGTAGGGVHRLASGAKAWSAASAGLIRNDVPSLHVGAFGGIFAGTSRGGVFRSTDDGDSWAMLNGSRTLKPSDGSWQNVNTMLPNTVVRSLAAYTDSKSLSTLLLAGTDSGVFLALAGFSGWKPLNLGLPNVDTETGLSGTLVNSLLINGSGELHAGTDSGVYMWSSQLTKFDPKGSWYPSPNFPLDAARRPLTVLKLIEFYAGDLMAATNSGVYLRRGNSAAWTPANNGLPTNTAQDGTTTPITVLALDAFTHAQTSTGAQQVTSILAGTSQGLYRFQDDVAIWSPVESALLQPLFTFDNPSPEVISALNQTKISDELRLQFQLNSFSLAPNATVASVPEPNRKWQIHDDQLRRTYNLQLEDFDLDVSLINTDVRALAADARGNVVVSTPLNGVAETEWPDFKVQSPLIDLETIHKGIQPDTYLALSQPASFPAATLSPPPSLEPPPEIVVCKVLDSGVNQVSAYSRSGTTTTIKTDAGDALSVFNRRTATVFLQSEQLPLFEAQVRQPTFIGGDRIQLDGVVQDFGARRKIIVSGKRARAFIVADLGGVIRLSDANCVRLGLAHTDISALAFDSQNNLLAGTQGAGLLRYAGALETPWEPLNIGATGNKVCALAFDSYSRNIYAGFAGDNGGELLRSSSATGDWTLVKLPVANNVTALVFDVDGQSFAGTDGGGIFRSNDGVSWEAAQTGLTNLCINSLALGRNGQIFAGTDGGGIFTSIDRGAHWQSINKGLDNLSISALVIAPTGRVYAGTRGGGVFILTGRSEHWKAINHGLTNKHIGALAVDPSSGMLYAGTHGDGVFQLSETHNRWQPLPTGVSNDVRALAISPNGEAYAGTCKVALMASADRTSFVELENILAGFTLPRKFQADFDLGIIPGAAQEIFKTNNETLAKDARLTIQLSGSLWLIASGESDLYLIKNEVGQLNVYRPNYALQIAAPPATEFKGKSLNWRLIDDSGADGFITACVDEIVQGAASPTGQTVGEVATALKLAADPAGKCTLLTLERALQNIFEAQTVQIYANVASATHGETVYPDEVLGSGNASQAHQRFVLKRPPLTYVPSTQTGLPESTLAVYISNAIQEGTPRIEPGSLLHVAVPGKVRWFEIDSLYNARNDRHVFMVRTNEKGQTSVFFGDGARGARLPSGRENVVASYRSGSGGAGNLDAGQLSILKTKPAGVRAVVNPVPASGGIDPETMDSAREMAPLNVRTMNRIVSLLDYEDFVRTMPAIGKVSVKPLYYGKAPLAHITVAASDGSPLTKDSATYKNLVKAIGASNVASQKFRVDSYEKVFFSLSAHVSIDRQQDQNSLQSLIESNLEQTFSFAGRDFGQDVEASEVLSLIQTIDGVVAVQLTELYLVGSSASLQPRLHAKPARFDPATQKIHPAQLLLINIHDGIQLRLEPTT